MNATQALDYLYQATVTDSSPADEVAREAIAVVRLALEQLTDALRIYADPDLYYERYGHTDLADPISCGMETPAMKALSLQAEPKGEINHGKTTS